MSKTIADLYLELSEEERELFLKAFEDSMGNASHAALACRKKLSPHKYVNAGHCAQMIQYVCKKESCR